MKEVLNNTTTTTTTSASNKTSSNGNIEPAGVPVSSYFNNNSSSGNVNVGSREQRERDLQQYLVNSTSVTDLRSGRRFIRQAPTIHGEERRQQQQQAGEQQQQPGPQKQPYYFGDGGMVL